MKREEKIMPTSHDSDWMDLFEAMKLGIIVIVKEEFRIKRYNQSAREIFNKDLALDTSITEVDHEFIYEDLISDLNQLFKDFEPIKKLVSTKGGSWFVIRFEPYKTSRENIDYVALSFVDVTDLKVEFEKKIELEKQLQLEILNVEEKERWRLGKYLHDGTAQNLLAIKMLFDIIDPQLQQLDEETREELKKIKRLIVKSEKNIRELSHFVLPIEVEGELSEEFHKLINQTKALYNIQCKFNLRSDMGSANDPAFVSSLYYITQEAIRNAITHGQADEVEVSLSSDEEFVYLNVKDNGIGYEEGDEDDGKGINIMRHRAELLGGDLDIAECQSGGTIVKCTIPLERTKEKE